jgi:hypothetical protein
MRSGNIPFKFDMTDLLARARWQSHTSMSGVVPAWRLMELLNTRKLREQRMQDEQKEAEKLKETPIARSRFVRFRAALFN